MSQADAKISPPLPLRDIPKTAPRWHAWFSDRCERKCREEAYGVTHDLFGRRVVQLGSTCPLRTGGSPMRGPPMRGPPIAHFYSDENGCEVKVSFVTKSTNHGSGYADIEYRGIVMDGGRAVYLEPDF